jgi:transposase
MYTLISMATLQKKTSRGHTYWQIVESRRVNGKPRPVVLMHLGTAEALLGRLSQEPSKALKARVFEFGPLAALWNIAQELEVVLTIDREVEKREQGLSCGEYMLLAALNRCVGATSKASLSAWYRQTILPRLLPASEALLASQRFWDHMAYLDAPALARIEEALAQRLVEHFKVDLRTLLFDATNFDTFIDTQTASDLAQRGHAKSKRADLRLLGLALLVSTDFHIPLLSHCYPGNQNDVSLFHSVTETLVSRYHQFAKDAASVTLVFDGGNTSGDNLRAIDQSGYHFITCLTLTHHKDLLDVPLVRFRPLAEERLHGVRAHRMRKELWGQVRTIVITRSDKLLAGQIYGIRAALRKKTAALHELRQKLLQSQRPNARGKGYTRESLQKRLDALTSGQYTAEILKTEILGTPGRLDVTFRVDTRAFEHLKRTRLGKRILVTDNHDWTTEEIILGSRAQAHIEDAFKQMKDPHWVSFSPAFHWTDQKLRVHAFYCVLALCLSSLLQRKAAQAGIRLTIPTLYEQLSAITEIVTLHAPGTELGRGRFRAQYLLSDRTPLQEKLCQVLDVYRHAHR